MIKKALMIPVIFAATLLLSGCSLSNPISPKVNPMTKATFMKSEDGGASWNPKMKIDDKKTIAGVDVLSVAIHPIDKNIIYMGTAVNGLFVTKDAGETWVSAKFPEKIYGLIIDPINPDIMYGSCVLGGRAKIFKRLKEDQEWQEIYTEPENGTVISSMAIDNRNPLILYAGTDKGVIIKTTDGGKTWINLDKAAGPVIGIGFDAADDKHVFFGVFEKGVLETKNGGTSIENISKKLGNSGINVFGLTTDPYLAGVVYVGTKKGIFRRSADESWKAMNLIASSELFPIRAITVNPKNSKEIMYSSAKAIYKSVDSGLTWSTFQLDTVKEISVLKYDSMEPNKIYTGLRNF